MRHIRTIATLAMSLFAASALAAATTPDAAVTAPAAAAPATDTADTTMPKVVVPDPAGPAASTTAAASTPPKAMMAPADAGANVLWYAQGGGEMRASKLIGASVRNPMLSYPVVDRNWSRPGRTLKLKRACLSKPKSARKLKKMNAASRKLSANDSRLRRDGAPKKSKRGGRGRFGDRCAAARSDGRHGIWFGRRLLT